MRLLNVDSLEFSEFYDEDKRPKYVIASHRWVKSEATFRDVRERCNVDGPGYKKVKAFARYVRDNIPSIKWLWIDTCCINKDSAAELSEAINLMFKWYRDAELCLAYLVDVEGAHDEDSFKASEWFKRGWTLQELLAPRAVVFVTRTWEVIGNKGASARTIQDISVGPGLEGILATVTNVPEKVLYDFGTSSGFSIDDKLGWMNGRKTTRGEDMSYALYGIFGVSPGANYGEGLEGARRRLLMAIHQRDDPIGILASTQPPLHAVSTVPFLRDPNFVERPALIEQLDTKLSIPGSRAALVGLGGAGKTQLAVEYARRVRMRSPQTWALWLHASSATRFEQSVRSIAEQVKITGRDDPNSNIFSLFHGWLCDRQNGDWLMILDNTDDADFLLTLPTTTDATAKRLIDYLPACEHGSILITTRSKREACRLTHVSQRIEVTPMESDSAEALLESTLGPKERACHGQLATALDFLPLAMAQASAYICERRPRYSVARYLDDLQKSRESRVTLLRRDEELPDRDREASSSILVTWQISFEYILEKRQSAAELLSAMSFCDRRSIPELLVRGERLDDEFEDDIAMLRGFSLISATSDHTSWEMHRLVQDATQLWLEDRGRIHVFHRRFLARWHKIFSALESNDWETSQVLFTHALHAADQPPLHKNTYFDWTLVLHLAGFLAMDWNHLAHAEKLLTCSAKWKVDQRSRLLTTYGIGCVYLYQRRWSEAEKIFLSVIEEQMRLLGPDHDDLLMTRTILDDFHSIQRHCKALEKNALMILQAHKRVMEPEHPDLFHMLPLLAECCSTQSRAEEFLVRSLKIQRALLGANHRDTMRSAIDLASVYIRQERWTAAERLGMDILERSKRAPNPDHLTILTATTILIRAYEGQGQLGRAEELLMQEVEGGTKVFSAEHPETCDAVVKLEQLRTLVTTSQKPITDPEMRDVTPSIRIARRKNKRKTRRRVREAVAEDRK